MSNNKVYISIQNNVQMFQNLELRLPADGRSDEGWRDDRRENGIAGWRDGRRGGEDGGMMWPVVLNNVDTDRNKFSPGEKRADMLENDVCSHSCIFRRSEAFFFFGQKNMTCIFFPQAAAGRSVWTVIRPTRSTAASGSDRGDTEVKNKSGCDGEPA